MLENVVTLLSSGVIIRNGGRALAFSESSARFIVPHPERGYITDDRPEIPLEDALIGVHVTSDESEVEALDIEWLWFAPGQERLVVEIASAARPAARYVTRESRSIRWKAEEVSLSRARGDPASRVFGAAAISWYCSAQERSSFSSPGLPWSSDNTRPRPGMRGSRQPESC